MCRSIKVLRPTDATEGSATEDEIRAAALQYVRKISGFRKPSKANEALFEQVVDEIAASSQRLLDSLTVGRRVA